jgi:hypothetical protein
MRIAVLASLLLTAAADLRPSSAGPTAGTTADWPYYGGDAGGSRYSPLTQIDRSNVAQLKIAWEYHTGDVSDGSDNRRKSEFETTPIVADGTMYFSTPFNASSLSTLKPAERNGASIRGSTSMRDTPKVSSITACYCGSMKREPRAVIAIGGFF